MNKIYPPVILAALLTATGVKAQGVPVISPVQGPSTLCSTPGEAGQYTVSASNSPTSYSWIASPAVGVVISNPTSSITNIAFPPAGYNYYIYCSASNISGTSNMVSKVVTVYETPMVTFSGATKFCQGSSTNLSASPTIISASSTLSYSWTPATGLNKIYGPTVTANPLITTTYSVLVSSGTCTNNAILTLTVENCVGISDNETSPLNVFIYPNPTNGEFSIKAGHETTVSIYNELAQLVMTISLRPAEIRISRLSHGVYYIVADNRRFKLIVTP
jgi:hypothetical protein